MQLCVWEVSGMEKLKVLPVWLVDGLLHVVDVRGVGVTVWVKIWMLVVLKMGGIWNVEVVCVVVWFVVWFVAWLVVWWIYWLSGG